MRKHFIDNLRWLVVILLIPYHAAQAFNTWGETNYVFFYSDEVLSSLIVFLSPFFMPLMFMLAGMSTKYSLEKRSVGQYLLERLKRLVVPLIFGTLAFCPVMSYIGDKLNLGYEGSFITHYGIFFTRWTNLTGYDGGFNVGQFWFLLYLFIISLLAAVVVTVMKKAVKKPHNAVDFPFPVICLFVMPLPLLFDLLSVAGKSFADYIYVFFIGYFVMTNEKTLEKTEKYRYVTLAAGLAACSLSVYMFIWSGRDFGMLNVIAKAFGEWFMILALTGIGKHSLDRKGKISEYMSSRSFPYFSIHFIWTVLFQYWFSHLPGGGVLTLFVLPVIAAFVATLACSEICIRIPLLCFLMGTKPAAPTLSADNRRDGTDQILKP